MRFLIRASIALITLCVPAAVVAQAVPPVTNLSAVFDGTQVTVRWKAPQGIDIAFYRVYHSTTSILENNGLYDDFEVTKGPETELRISPPPGVGAFYAAVLAVSHSGQESPYFVEETSVITGGAATSSIPKPPTPAAPVPSVPDVPKIPEESTVKILKGEAVTPEEIRITTSSPLTVDPAKAPSNLSIAGQNATTLRIIKLTINGSVVTISTEKQTKGTVYNVSFGSAFTGVNGKPLDATDRSVFVTAHKDGQEPTAAPVVRKSNPYAPPDVSGMRITPMIQGNGGYALTVEWAVDNGPRDLVYLVVYQTRDGQTFGPPSVIPVDVRGAQLADVTPGFFGIFIQTVNVYGYLSPGVFHYVSLPPYGPGGALRGELLFGQTDMKDFAKGTPTLPTPDFDVVDEATTGELATLQVQDAPALSAAATELSFEAPLETINWKHAAVLAAAVAGMLVLIVLAITLTQKCNRSCGN